MPEGERPVAGPDERRVLVVDDDPSIQGFLAEALADEGYEVRTAGNGREALGVLGSWLPDLILLDLMMPEMDGWVFRAAQRTMPEVAEVPVIVLSATRDLTTKVQSLAPAEVFAKPFDLERLLGTIERLTER
jgi:two-component system chemotaxis response regulator CheY